MIQVTSQVQLWPALYRGYYGRNFLANETLTQYYATLDVLRSFLGNAVVDGAASIAQEQLWSDDMADIEHTWRNTLSEDAEVMLVAQTALLGAIQRKQQELGEHSAVLRERHLITSIPELKDGEDDLVQESVVRIVGEQMARLRKGEDDFDLNRSMEDSELMDTIESVNFTVPYWVPDEQCSECTECGSDFGFWNRKHHCRGCGKIFCNDCSPYEGQVPWRKGDHRMCEKCHVFFGDSAKLSASMSPQDNSTRSPKSTRSSRSCQ
eukprot:TRINITY_DN55913_c0_g1_i1.p1 TRINITY_DN55913_c0_g1~~TRINITY_DN55913_c0_g1_i1.p1  ORF type:complete len:265 (-),score=69.66 TRINITY_DN55913_c0_g1_i1:335-1129(-)